MVKLIIKVVFVEFLISACDASRYLNDMTTAPVKTIVSVGGKPLTINKCQANTTVSYCWLKHPNGTEFLNTKKDVNASYWYSDNDLDVGKCSITLKVGSENDNGIWTCHMGKTSPAGEEILDEVLVRITGPVAAVEPVVTAKVGSEVSLQCVTAGGNLNLDECRFITPNGMGFNIDETSTEKNPVLGEYYFKKDSTLSSGECSVTIAKVKSEHFGSWSCIGKIQIEETEYRDIILLQNYDGGLSVASVTGIVIGMAVVLASLSVLGYVTWKKRNPETPTVFASWRRGRRTEELGLNNPRPSNESQTSATQLTSDPQIVTATYGASSTV